MIEFITNSIDKKEINIEENENNYPIKRNIEELNILYTQGGLEFMGKYFSIIREKWKERFLWFDAGE